MCFITVEWKKINRINIEGFPYLTNLYLLQKAPPRVELLLSWNLIPFISMDCISKSNTSQRSVGDRIE